MEHVVLEDYFQEEKQDQMQDQEQQKEEQALGHQDNLFNYKSIYVFPSKTIL